MSFHIVGFGGNVVDCMLRLEGIHFPERRADWPVEERPIAEWTIQGGGIVATAMAAAGRLGARATMLTTVGDDAWGAFVISGFQRHGVDTSHVIVDPSTATGMTFILIGEKGSNRWVSADMIADWDLPPDLREAVQWKKEHPRSHEGPQQPKTYSEAELASLIEGEILNLGGFPAESSLTAARIAREKGIPVCYDMYVHRDALSLLPELLQNTTHCIPSREAARAFTGETDPEAMCRRLLSYGPEVGAVTLGEEGVILATREEIMVQEAFQVPIVDTTGAGDVFHGAFSFGIVQGWELPRILAFSSAAAALNCHKLGGRAAIPTLPEVEAFLSDRTESKPPKEDQRW
jgi:sugar/nucleoside kinase (ribokinase family)